jgi:hypothetical protein
MDFGATAPRTQPALAHKVGQTIATRWWARQDRTCDPYLFVASQKSKNDVKTRQLEDFLTRGCKEHAWNT